MIEADIVDFYDTYTGVMEDGEIARELRLPVSELKRTVKAFSSLCWTCSKACNGRQCTWVRYGIYPSYVDMDEDGRIVRCERYKEDA